MKWSRNGWWNDILFGLVGLLLVAFVVKELVT